MSYILDALRRADEERERGAVPGLHARPLSVEPVGDAGSTRRLPWPAMAVGAVVTAGVVAGTVWWMRPAAALAPAVVVAAAPPPPMVMPMPAPAPLPAPLPPAMPAPPPPSPPPSPLPSPLLFPTTPEPTAAPAVPAKPRAEKVERVAKVIEKPAAPKPPPPPKEPEGPPATPLSQVPPEVKSQLPPISIGGSIYSNNAESRFVIINGQVVREGEPAATGIVLERVGPKSAILRWREWRIEVPL